MLEGRLCVFAKAPVPGLVKTRLAAALGHDKAAALASAFLEDTWSRAREVAGERAVLAWDGDAGAKPIDIDVASLWPQGRGDLGARLETILRRAIADAPWAIAIGSDTPHLSSEQLQAATAALDTHDAVIGPSEDGGFYLVGLRSCPTGIFAELPWSSTETFARTLARLAEYRLSTATLETWFDIDRAGDLKRVRALMACGEVRLPATERCLRERPC